MKANATVLGFAALAGVCQAERTPGCNADNCLRALRNVHRPGAADCSEYLKVVVTPSPVKTVTQVVVASTTPTVQVVVTDTATLHQSLTSFTTVTTQVVPVRIPDKRDVELPAYATPCSGAVRYRSACSCLGVSAWTLTATAPTSTQTITQLVTPTTETQIITATTETTTATDIVLATTTTTVDARASPVPFWGPYLLQAYEAAAPLTDTYVRAADLDGRVSAGNDYGPASQIVVSNDGYLFVRFKNMWLFYDPSVDGGYSLLSAHVWETGIAAGLVPLRTTNSDLNVPEALHLLQPDTRFGFERIEACEGADKPLAIFRQNSDESCGMTLTFNMVRDSGYHDLRKF